MGAEKKGYRDTLASLNEMFPDKGVLDRADTARFMGRSISTVRRKIIFKDGLITKADLARQICL